MDSIESWGWREGKYGDRYVMNGLIDEQVESTSIMQVSIASYDSSIHSQRLSLRCACHP